MIDPKTVFPKCPDAIIEAVDEYAPRYGISNMAMFWAQAGHESGEFTVFKESLNYSTSALLSLFGRHRISVADAQAFGRNTAHAANQEAIANCIYGGVWGAKNLGNTEAGDGWKYRGRGIFQLTGRANYQAFQDAHPDIPVMENPDILVEPAEAVISACWFWRAKNMNWYGRDVVAATKAINGGQNGLAHRKELFAKLGG